MAKNSALLSAGIAAAVTAAAFLLNPSPEKHRDRIKARVAERSPLSGALGLGALKAFTSEYHTIGIASYTTFDDHVLSIGAFGVVVVMSPDTGNR
jgi:hypothetical protein